MLKTALYKKSIASTAFAMAGEPTPPLSTCFSNVASRAVHTKHHVIIMSANVVSRLTDVDD